MRMEAKNNTDTKEFLYVSAVLLKLYKAKLISRKVYEIAEEKCRKRLCKLT